MFDIGSPELLLVAVVAIVVIGPKDLPKAMRLAGYWVGRARGVMRQFRSGFDAMVREAELQEMDRVELRIIAMRQPMRIAGDRGDIAGKHHVAVRKSRRGRAG